MVTLLGLRVTMGGGDYLLSDGLAARLVELQEVCTDGTEIKEFVVDSEADARIRSEGRWSLRDTWAACVTAVWLCCALWLLVAYPLAWNLY
ncbi:hypothetical protein EVAR_28845_1 [Eumeta japonica]|uniref:Uncharacterized protein n=1 Tax=Eumeta variegata TaxID=151549 RepID=A0A4C1YKW7_EUMVA|nr:hypothetical protein EVAR_28845_1 [Eumeta japonica]